MPTNEIVDEVYSYVSVSMSGGFIEKTENDDQFEISLSDGPTCYVHLTPAQAAQWAEVLAGHAKQVTA